MGIQSEVHMGDEIRIKGARLYPLSKVVHWTPGNRGVVWNRPDSIFVKEDNGEEHILPVRDLTRQAQVAVLAAGALISLFIWLYFRK